MEAKNVIVNERTIKGYIELHKIYNEPLSDGKMGEILLKKIFPLFGASGLVTAGLLAAALPAHIVLIPIIASTLVGFGIVQHEENKEKKDVINKYPFLSPTLSCEDLDEILEENEAIIYNNNCYHYDEHVLERKKYVEKCNEILKETTSMGYSTSILSDVEEVEIPKVKKLGTISEGRNRILK